MDKLQALRYWGRPWWILKVNISLAHLLIQSSWSQHGAHLGPVGPRWAPYWPHESCYQGRLRLIRKEQSYNAQSMQIIPLIAITLMIRNTRDYIHGIWQWFDEMFQQLCVSLLPLYLSWTSVMMLRLISGKLDAYMPFRSLSWANLELSSSNWDISSLLSPALTMT